MTVQNNTAWTVNGNRGGGAALVFGVGPPTQKAVYIALLLSARRDSPLKATRFVFFKCDLTSLHFNKHEDKYVAARARTKPFNIERKGKRRGHEF